MKLRITTLITGVLCLFVLADAALAISTFTVTNTGNAGAGSLRQAILDANATPNSGGPDLINFAIGGAGPHTISPASGLPVITDPVVINGFSQPGSAPNTNATGALNTVLMIELNGTSAPGSNGLTMTAGGSTVRGLAINRFTQQGIYLQTTGGNVIEGNFIGTNITGTAVLQNGNSGVYMDSPNNVIGGTTPGARNLSSGNFFHCVEINGAGATGNQVQGNLLGTNAAGTASLTGTTSFGVFITAGAGNNVVGGTTPAARNVISGNALSGILLRDTSGNRVEGNYIGTDVNGTADLGNAGNGVGIENSDDNTVGGTTAGARNLISGNQRRGISIFSGSTGNEIQGNFIGTDVTGGQPLGNSHHGIQVEESPSNTVGGTAPGAGNLVSSNGIVSDDSDGIVIFGAASTGNLVQGNFVGTDVTGTQPLANATEGVAVGEGASNNTIGGSVPGARNLISGNTGGDGVAIYEGGTLNRVEGNFIGTDINGTGDLGNGDNGVSVGTDCSNNAIGGTSSGAGNVIADNGDTGVVFYDNASLNRVEGNFIGTDFNGTVDLGNDGTGVVIADAAQSNTIGGTVLAARNIISGNQFGGVAIFDSASTGNLVQGNFIGTDINGTADLGNQFSGIYIENAANNTIGGTAPGAANLISGNDDNGVEIVGAPAQGNQILGNRIYSNAGVGIDLGDDNVTANDAGDIDTGANQLQNFPVLTNASTGGGNTTINGSLDSIANTSFRLEFFASSAADPTGHGEGQTFLGSLVVTTNGAGNAPFSAVLPLLPPGGQTVISATATDPSNNTSEFSQVVQMAGGTASQLLNISTRLRVQTGENVLIGGFIVTGIDPKQVIIRAIGPSLSGFFPDALADPTLELFQGSTLLATNDNWRVPGQNESDVLATGIPPADNLESALVRTLQPGAYTAIVRGSGGASGIGLVEAYDLAQVSNSKLANISTRGFVETDNNVMIGGFIIGPAGGSNATVVVRAIGPSLSAFIPGALQDPTLELKDANGTTLISNDDWQLGQPAEIQQAGLAPTDTRESALLATLAPGSYTAIVRGAGNTTGVGLVEVYYLH